MATASKRPEDGTVAARHALWRLYALLSALRLLASVLMMGMVHPDEFFQSQEVMTRHVLAEGSSVRRELFLPWEFALPSPNRSVLFPALIAGAPYKLLQWIGVPVTGLLMLLVPRVLLCILSFAIDAVLYYGVGKIHRRAEDVATRQVRVLVAFASAWPTVVFLTRPFSNSFETLVLALAYGALLLANPHRRLAGLHVQTLLLGALLAVGFFTRFTFAFFFLPIGLELVMAQDSLLVERMSKKGKSSTTSGGFLVHRLWNVLSIAIQGFLAFVAVAGAIVAADTIYFHPEVLTSDKALQLEDIARQLVVAPINNLMYNLKYDNLELHGVHPRITHFAVNMPMLFGPLFLLFLSTLVRNQLQGRTGVGALSVLLPVLLISLAPHQEPRFLLPAMVPLHLFTSSDTLVERRMLFSLWLVFNAALAIFFGLLHQGGIVPMLLTLSGDPSNSWMTTGCDFSMSDVVAMAGTSTLPVVFSMTYMPPRFLLAAATSSVDLHVFDIGGKSVDELQDFLEQDNELLSRWTATKQSQSALLVVPGSVGIPESTRTAATEFDSWNRVGACGFHISTEDFGAPFTLELYHLTLADTSRKQDARST